MPPPKDPEKRLEWGRHISEAKKGTGIGEANSFFGKKHTEETIEIMKDKRKQASPNHTPRSKKACENIRIAAIKRSADPVYRENMRKAKSNISDTSKIRIRDAAIKRSNTPTWRLNQSISHTGVFPSEETRTKQSETQKRRYREHPELREAVRVRSTGRKPSAETLQKISGPNCYMYKNGQSFGRYCFRFNNRRKNATRDFFKIEDHRICICCGITEDENIVKGKWEQFSVHHLDHDRDQGCNGKPFNLISLCHICHSRERHHEEEYKAYLNKVLREGFKWGIWSEQEYIEQVMYPE